MLSASHYCPNSQLIRLRKSAKIRQPSGVEVGLIIENLADSNWQLAVSQKAGTWFLVFGTWRKRCDPLPDWDWDWDWVTLGSPLGHARATQAPRKGGPRVELRKCFVCKRNGKRPGGVRKNRTLPLINTDNSDQETGSPGLICVNPLES
jgi:hypothetical protein